jgi:rod shape-determining protein MreB
MLYEFLKSMDLHKVWNKPRMIISLPCEVTQFEKRAVEEAGRDIGARYVHLLDEPVAAAIGAGLPVTESRGSMLVDIGGGTTEIAVISLGGIVTSRAVRLGGYSIDQVLIHHLRHQYRFEIGEQTAEKLKIEAGSALPNVTRFGLVGGLDLQTGLPKRRAVSSKLIYEAINSVISDIIIEIKKSLEAVPPEISGDIAEDGIVLAGGGALLNGLRERIELETGVPVRVADSPLISVAKGGAMALENNKLFDMLKRPA